MACAWKRSRQTSPVTATPPWSCSASIPTTSVCSTGTSPTPIGDEVAKQIVIGSGMPILMPTAADRLDDKATGFELGADDYLTKPFELRELVLRQGALLQAYPTAGRLCGKIAGLRAKPFRREVYRDGR